MYRQGDVLLEPTTIPRTAKVVNRTQRFGRKRGLILAYGEATGHHHSIDDSLARMLEDGEHTYVRIPPRGAFLRHEEHHPLNLEGGEYEVRRQREYDAPEAGEDDLPNARRWSYVRD